MTQRTIKFYGQGLASGTAEITVTLQGQTVFSGPVYTSPDILAPEHIPVLFSLNNFAVTDQGSFPITITPTVGDVVVSKVLANYTLIINPVYTWDQWEIITDPSQQEQALEIISSLANPPFSEAELAVLVDPNSTQAERDAILAAHGVSYTVNTGSTGFSDDFWEGDSRTNVTVGGQVPPEPPTPRPGDLQGDWGYVVPNNQVMTFNFNLTAGVE